MTPRTRTAVITATATGSVSVVAYAIAASIPLPPSRAVTVVFAAALVTALTALAVVWGPTRGRVETLIYVRPLDEELAALTEDGGR